MRGAGQFRCLAVDASRSGLDDLMEFGRLTVDKWLPNVDLDDLGLDFIAVSIPRRGRHGSLRRVRAALIYEDSRITAQQLRDLSPGDFVHATKLPGREHLNIKVAHAFHIEIQLV